MVDYAVTNGTWLRFVCSANAVIMPCSIGPRIIVAPLERVIQCTDAPFHILLTNPFPIQSLAMVAHDNNRRSVNSSPGPRVRPPQPHKSNYGSNSRPLPCLPNDGEDSGLLSTLHVLLSFWGFQDL
ncbi:hypothetical protein T440DRAFT_46583 [Plenodomus tracheiphilus IPT5]|uniref:Uncharacterized protein n=1 Tax=Plenodomus tracheiphilus IPT5 TaxID=1408161 RepID=A0A6A7B932_9PLEO|nr:hypothetical protein T440DRAFT_46583 [Plenodomus tracheiphilus IPT5]